MHTIPHMTPIEGSLAAIGLAMAGPAVGLGIALVSLLTLSVLMSVARWLVAAPVRGDERGTARRPASVWPAD